MPRPRLNFRWDKLQRREKTWIILWVVAILGVANFKLLHQPRGTKVREVREQIAGLEEDKITLMAKQPDIRKRQSEIDQMKKEISGLYEQLVTLEEKLLNVQDVDQLLESLIKDRARFEMRLNSIRPIQQKEPAAVEPQRPDNGGQPTEPYRKLKVQIDTYSSFQGLVNYIDFLEGMRPYQQVEGIKVQVEGREVSRPHAILLVTTLLGETLEAKEATRKEIFSLLEQVAAREGKDPFLTADKPKEVVQAVGLELTGVFSEGGRPVAAMINNEIYRVGDVVDNKKIVAIEPNRVLLEFGNRQFVLMPSQKAEANQ